MLRRSVTAWDNSRASRFSRMGDTNLSGADLTGAHLMGTHLTGAFFSSADLMKARGIKPKSE